MAADVELALALNKLVHNRCQMAPHDIGLELEKLVRSHRAFKQSEKRAKAKQQKEPLNIETWTRENKLTE